MEILVENLQKRVALNPPQVLKIAKTILQHEGVKKVSLSIVFVTRQKIQALNKKFLHRTYSTDVLAFDARENVSARNRRKPQEIAGDIIISTDEAFKNSRIYGTALSKELALYVIHGILHLLGYDDHVPTDVKKMRQKEQELLNYLGRKTNTVIRS